ncbi:MAG: hypothetical protein FWE02_07090 [Defluviitaleaceae bacterium]|nr:hypothetical protein [Defluviitaleaceae bacterium]
MNKIKIVIILCILSSLTSCVQVKEEYMNDTQICDQAETDSKENIMIEGTEFIDELGISGNANLDENFEIWESDVELDFSLFYDIFDLDYILLTSADFSEYPQKIVEGDVFIGLKVEVINFSSAIIIDNKFYRPWDAEVQFSGEIIVKGNLTISFMDSGSGHCMFFVDEAYLNLFPWLVNDQRDRLAFEIVNYKELFGLLEINEKGIHPHMGFYEFENLVIKIDKFILRLFPSNVGNSAEIVEVISLSGQQVQY